MRNFYCKGCHSSADPQSGVALDNYNVVKAVASDGRLVGVIKRLPGFPAMPSNGNKLSYCKIRQVEKLISAGAQNN